MVNRRCKPRSEFFEDIDCGKLRSNDPEENNARRQINSYLDFYKDRVFASNPTFISPHHLSGCHPMPPHTSPEVVIQRQLDAYNAKDLERWLSTYAPSAKQYELGGQLLAEGHAQIRARTAQRFNEPDLHAQLIRREVFGNVVVDHEDVTRTFPEGPGCVELVCVYVVENGLIQSASFAFGPPAIFPISLASQ